MSGRWRIELTPGLTPKHWRFFRGDEALPRFTLGEITDGAALDVLEALNAYGQPVSEDEEPGLCGAIDESDFEDEDDAECELPAGHAGAHFARVDGGLNAYWTTDGSDVLTGEKPDEDIEDEDPECLTCEDERWLPNDEAESEADPVWKPCPDCNPKGAIPCPYVFEEVEA